MGGMLETGRRAFLAQAAIAPFCAGALLAYPPGWSPFVVAETRHGTVRGVDDRGIKLFKGIPYGASTAGRNRFMPPVDPPRWSGVRDAIHYGLSAPQRDPTPPPPGPPPPKGPNIFDALESGGPTPGEGEDCLVLNVWTPAVDDGRKRPVMVWLHGGGFTSGSGSFRWQDGTNLAARGDVVVVSINHRLNVMGFANFSAFSPDFAASGDAGMLDIVHALTWVRDNIARFGGDPDTVMLFGQSGGGRKIQTLLAMPSARGLFHRAAVQSGVAIRVVDRDTATRNAERILAKLGIATADVHDIQTIPYERIMSAYHAVSRDLGGVNLSVVGFVPTVDGTILPQHPFDPVASPVMPDVPMMIGHTRTEYTGLTTEAAAWTLDEPQMRARIRDLIGERSEAIVDLYRKASPGASPTEIFFLIESDYRYGAPTMVAAQRRAALGRAPVYLYYITWASPVQGGQLMTPHNMEVPFAFDNAQIMTNLTGGGADAIAMADKISDSWIAFARTGNPDTPKLPHWPAYTAADRATMILDNVCKVAGDPLRAKRVALYRELGYS